MFGQREMPSVQPDDIIIEWISNRLLNSETEVVKGRWLIETAVDSGGYGVKKPKVIRADGLSSKGISF